MRLVLQKLLLLVFGLALSLALLEVGLRVGGAVVRRVADRSSPVGEEGGFTILCVGDSHTYGTGVQPDQTYPSWLQRDLRRVDPQGRYRVINMGVPGMNSAQLVGELAGWLERFDPDVVVVWSGLNNLWNRSDPAPARELTGREWISRKLGAFKVVRLLTLFQTQEFLTELEDEDPAVAVVSARANTWLFSERRSDEDLHDTTMRDHEAMADILWRHQVPFVMLAYPRVASAPVAAHRDAVVAVGRRLAVPVVQTSKALRRARKKFPRAQLICTPYEVQRKACLLVNAMGPHPTGPLYSMISKLVGGEVMTILDRSPEAPDLEELGR